MMTNAILNITNRFDWGGSNNYMSSDQQGSIISINPSATANLFGKGNTQYLYFQFINYGTVVYSCSKADGPGITTVQAGTNGFRNYGQFLVKGVTNAALQPTSYYTTFYNYANFIVNVTDDFQMTYVFNNYDGGNVDVIGGIFRMQYGATFYAGSTIGQRFGGVLQFESQTFTLNTGATLRNGSGVVFATGSTFNVNGGNFLPTTLSLAGGNINFMTTQGQWNFDLMNQNRGGTVTFSGLLSSSRVGTYYLNSTTPASMLVVNGGAQLTVDNLYLIGTSNYIDIRSTAPYSQLNVTTWFEWGGYNNYLNGDSGNTNAMLNLLPTSRSRIYGGGTTQYVMVQLQNYGNMTYSCERSNGGYGISTYYAGYAGLRNQGNLLVTGSSVVMFYQNNLGPMYNYGKMVVNVTTDFQTTNTFSNYGRLDVVGGTCRLNNGGTAYDGSVMSHNPGAFIQFEAGTFTQNAGAIITNGSGIIFYGGTADLNGIFQPNNFQCLGGSANFNTPGAYWNFPVVTMARGGTITFGGSYSRAVIGTFTLNQTVTPYSTLTVSNTAQLTVDYLYLLGTSNTINIRWTSPASQINVTTWFEWGGNNNQLTSDSGNTLGMLNLMASCRSNIYGTGTSQYLQVQLHNYGNLTYSCPKSNGYGVSTWWSGLNGFRNWGTMTVLGSSVVMYYQQYQVPFYNYGKFIVNTTVSFEINNAFQNYGSVEVIQGTLRLLYGGAAYDGSVMSHSPGAFIQFEAQTFTQNAGAVFTNGSGIIFYGGQVNIYGQFQPKTFKALGGNANFAAAGETYYFATIVQDAGGQIAFTGTGGSASIGAVYLNKTTATGSEFYVAGSAQVTIGSLYLLGTGNFVTVKWTTPASQINVTTWFEWGGTNNYLASDSGNTLGMLNLLPSCNSKFYGSGQNQYLQLQLHNYGNVTYACERANGYGISTWYSGLNGVRNWGTMTVSGTSIAMFYQQYVMSFYNYGLMIVNTTVDFQISNVFQNYGTVNVIQGMIRLLCYGNSLSGSKWSHQPGAFIKFENSCGGTFTHNTGATITAGDGIIFNSGSIDLPGRFEPTYFKQEGGSVTFREPDYDYVFTSITMNGNIYFGVNGGATGNTVTADSWRIQGTVAMSLYLWQNVRATFGSLYLTTTGATSYIYLYGSSSQIPTVVNITNYFEISGSNQISDQSSSALEQVNLMPSATANVSCTSCSFAGQFNVYGTMYAMSSWNVFSAAPTRFTVMRGGMLYVTPTGPSSQLIASATTPLFINYGTIQISASNYFQTSSIQFHNYGLVDLRRGLFDIAGYINQLYNGSTLTYYTGCTVRMASMTVAAGSNIKSGSSLNFAGSTTFNAPLLQTAVWGLGGTVTLNAGGSVGSYTLTGGTLSIPATSPLTTFGLLNCTASTVFGTMASVNITTLDITSMTATFQNGINATIGIANVRTTATLALASSARGTVSELYLLVSGAVTLATNAVLNVVKRFDWSSTNGITGGFNVNLLSTCRSVWSGSGAAMYLSGQLENYGTIQYQPTGTSGINMQSSPGVTYLRNQVGGIFNVSGTANTYFSPSTSPNTFYFHNLGTMMVNLPAANDFYIPTMLNNTGTILINSGSLRPYSLQHRAGFVTLNGNGKLYVSPAAGAVSPATALLQTGGTLQGTGIVYGTVSQSAGIVRPGVLNPYGVGSIGTLTLDTLTQANTNTFVEIAFSSATAFSKLVVTGVLTMAGVLSVASNCPYYPNVGDTFNPIITYASKSGSFFNAIGVGGFTLTPNYQATYTSVQIATTPGSSWTCSTPCDQGFCCPSNQCNCNPGYGGPTCGQSICGDGLVVGNETCDDGNTVSGDGCSATCQLESNWNCTKTAPTVCIPVCGDGVVVGSEGCDDGNRVNGDGCDSSCNVETGWACSATPGNKSGCMPICGDSIIRGNETCDDGNNDPGDGCSATCQIEFGYTCVGLPSFCATTCGDGLKAGLEQCDDGNTRPNDGCTLCMIDPGWWCIGDRPSVCQFGSPPATTVGTTSTTTTSSSTGTTSTGTTSTGTSAGTSTLSATSTSSSSGVVVPPPPPTNWPPPGCASPDDFEVLYFGVPAFTVSANTGYCSCISGYYTNGNVTANAVTAMGPVSASSVMYPVFYSTQPASRFTSTATSGWVYTGESITITLSTPTRLRFVMRQMVSNTYASNFAYAVSLSGSSGSYSRGCNSPASRNFVPSGLEATTSAEWYCTVPAGTTSYYVYINVISGGGNWAVANEASATRSLSDLFAAAS
eukprot:TRINITY_DN156_c0_g1_i3.p1 TRINITY_DN156_c0_g1~~TRINITY_DN156_c0_g1_i3.p1  ORF type:complete len:2233 (+),score=811.24 TRINITY_DN156_c0_g1_i3:424-7122(+)